ncbi:hypothetical protein [Pseudoteredinibacter isoporae]|uniref:hypothetical protein n=1 Tax=Pseudoteredinibacter isoporae TaxID=570281 RepID=UPI00310A00D5
MSPSASLFSVIKSNLAYQFNYLMLCIVWNIAGLILLSNGEPALGPTASVSAIAVLLGFACAIALGVWRWPYLYMFATAILMFLASSAVIPAYTQDPSLWPSDYWRYGGALLNGLGALVCARGLLGFWQWRSRHAES